ncbi:hypothetical protein KUTeg_018776 [Tegillarca granosa]|uniref:HTH psq-type domain-containing protein n=1 Tax=Tegillarca granosa TaxID=220873 RepID=A0ABQ9EE93_TEGGR|nr:hypothetical protein KUTeg_018776 [Tegillarca granosa]
MATLMTLTYLTPNCIHDRVHNLWLSAGFNMVNIHKACIKARLVSGVYLLQGNKHRFNQHNLKPTCQLCMQDPETRMHFILDCSALTHVREPYLFKLRDVLLDKLQHHFDRFCECKANLLQCILDIMHPSIPLVLQDDVTADKIESIARGLCFAIHIKRSEFLGIECLRLFIDILTGFKLFEVATCILQIRPEKKYRLYSHNQLADAYNAVTANGVSVYTASRRFGIPEQTLRDRVKGFIEVDCVNSGRSPVLSLEEEAKLVNHLVEMAKLGYGYTRQELTNIASNYAVQLNKRSINNPLTLHWFHSFRSRWSGIKVVQARSLEFARAKGASMATVESYFKELDQVLSKYNLKDSPHLIFNIDESGFMTNNKPPFVVTSSEINFKPLAVTSPRSQTVTVIGAGSASGVAVPPYFVFPGARMMPDLLKDGTPGADAKRHLMHESKKNFQPHENIDRTEILNEFASALKDVLPNACLFKGVEHTVNKGASVPYSEESTSVEEISKYTMAHITEGSQNVAELISKMPLLVTVLYFIYKAKKEWSNTTYFLKIEFMINNFKNQSYYIVLVVEHEIFLNTGQGSENLQLLNAKGSPVRCKM